MSKNNINIVMEGNEIVADYDEEEVVNDQKTAMNNDQREAVYEQKEVVKNIVGEKMEVSNSDQLQHSPASSSALSVLSSSVAPSAACYEMFEKEKLSWASRFREQRFHDVKQRNNTCPIPVEVFLIDLVYDGDLIGFVLLNSLPIIDFLTSGLCLGNRDVRLPFYLWTTLSYPLRKRFHNRSVQEAFLKRILSIGCAQESEFHKSFYMLTKFTLALSPKEFDKVYEDVVEYLFSEPVSKSEKSKGSLVKVQFQEVCIENLEEIKALEFCIYQKDVRVMH